MILAQEGNWILVALFWFFWFFVCLFYYFPYPSPSEGSLQVALINGCHLDLKWPASPRKMSKENQIWYSCATAVEIRGRCNFLDEFQQFFWLSVDYFADKILLVIILICFSHPCSLGQTSTSSHLDSAHLTVVFESSG